MSDTNFQPIFDYLDQSLVPVNTSLVGIHDRLEKQESAIANLAAMVKTYHEEVLTAHHRIDRIEAFMKKVSEKTGIPIPF